VISDGQYRYMRSAAYLFCVLDEAGKVVDVACRGEGAWHCDDDDLLASASKKRKSKAD